MLLGVYMSDLSVSRTVTQCDVNTFGELGFSHSDRFSIISVDPPWTYNDKKLNRGGANRHYDTMSLEEIKSMNVGGIAADDCLLMMWATAPLLDEALSVIKAWGFQYKTVGFVWAKRSERYWDNVAKRIRRDIAEYANLFEGVEEGKPFSLANLKAYFGDRWVRKIMGAVAYHIGMGSYTRANAEFVLFAVKGRGSTLIKDHSVSQIIDACVMDHSRKPDEYFELVDKLVGTDVMRLEIFARQRRAYWLALGDQVDSDFYLDDDMNICRYGAPVNLNKVAKYRQEKEIKIEENQPKGLEVTA